MLNPALWVQCLDQRQNQSDPAVLGDVQEPLIAGIKPETLGMQDIHSSPLNKLLAETLLIEGWC